MSLKVFHVLLRGLIEKTFGALEHCFNSFKLYATNIKSQQNAIRTNLSLHKCFVRYEDDFGSFWMVRKETRVIKI